MALLSGTNAGNTSFPLGGSGNDDLYINGNRPITLIANGITGINPGKTDIRAWLESLFYPSQAPIASLSINYIDFVTNALQIEKMAAGAALPITLSWLAGRQAATEALASIIVNGVAKTFTSPTASANVSGTQAATMARNVNTSFSISVATTDGKTATATAAVSFLDYLYYGFTATSTPDNSTVINLQKFFTTTNLQNNINAGTPTGPKYLTIAFPEFLDSAGNSKIWIGGLDQTGAFTRTVAPLTNASGYTSNYIFYILSETTDGAIIFDIK